MSGILRTLVVASMTVLISALLFSPLGADDHSGDEASIPLPTGQPPEVFAPRLTAQDSQIAPPPFTLLTPIRELLSGPLWLMVSGLDAQKNFSGGIPRQRAGVRPGLAWHNLPQVFTAPQLPMASASSSAQGQLVPFRDPAPSFSRNILVTRDFSNTPLQTEPHLAINPKDPEHLLLGAIDYNFPNVSTYVSIDGGVTWEGPHQPQFLRDDDGVGGDPVIAFDRNGNAFVAFISIGVEEYTVGPAVDFATVSSIAVARSNDGGYTWGEAISSARSGLDKDLSVDESGKLRGEVALSFLDKPWMTVGLDPDDPDQDVIYVTYTKFTQRFGIFRIGDLPFFGVPVVDTTIELVSSRDGGLTWTTPVSVSPTVRRIFGESTGSAGQAESQHDFTVQSEDEDEVLGIKRTVQGSQVAVDPQGKVYVAWLDSTDDEAFEGLGEIYVSRSDDGGSTFSEPARASVFNEPGFAPRTAFFRYWASAFPQLAVGLDGEVYVAYTGIPSETREDDGDIYVVRSFDRGDTWSRPIRINDDETDRLQFFPSITTDSLGVLHAMWGDMRDDRADTRYHIYYTKSDDQGDNWGFVDQETGFQTQNARVTDFPSNPNKGFPGGRFIGDYFSIKATPDDVYMVWADTRLGEFGPVNQKVGFSRRKAVASPEVFISPPSGPGGQSVTIQGFNFQPDIDLFIQVGGVLVSTERANGQGRFTTQVFIPISGEGAHDVTIFDDSGNFATASFFMEFGFDNVQDVQSALQRQMRALQHEVQGMHKSVSSALSDELDKIAESLRQVSTAPKLIPEPPSVAEDPRNGGLAWWILPLGVGIAALAGSGVTLLVMQRSGSRNEPPSPPSTWQQAP
jgi:hypothetical protein